MDEGAQTTGSEPTGGGGGKAPSEMAKSESTNSRNPSFGSSYGHNLKWIEADCELRLVEVDQGLNREHCLGSHRLSRVAEMADGGKLAERFAAGCLSFA